MDYPGVASGTIDTFPHLVQVRLKMQLAIGTQPKLACTRQRPEKQFCVEFLQLYNSGKLLMLDIGLVNR